jgi:hypothetical protein
MNLVQVQERLKDMPTQVIMSYANGMNPEVPPYLALGELNRRKQMEQKAAQPPQGTVKDNIEQQMGVMQLQAAKQKQMAQQMAQQGAEAQMPVPPGIPQPQDQPQMEDSGVAGLPMPEMNFGSGGIVAFANLEGNQLVEDEEKRKIQRIALQNQTKVPNPILPEPVDPVAVLSQRAMQAPEELPNREAMMAEAAKTDPYLNKMPGQQLETGIAGLRAGYGKQQETFDKNEEAAARAALWKGLIEGGESTRGIRGGGLRGLGTGAGKSFLESMEGARTREMAQQNLVNERNFNLTKMEDELEKSRIATSQGRFNDAYNSKIKAAEFKQNAQKNANELLGRSADIKGRFDLEKDRQLFESGEGVKKRDFEGAENTKRYANDVALEKIRQSAPAAMTKEIDDYIKRAKLDPSNADKTDYELYKQWAVDKQGSTPELKRAALIEKASEAYLKLGFTQRDELKNQGIDTLDKYVDWYINKSGKSSGGGGDDLKAKAIAAFGSYEPDKYEYRVGPEGNIQRKPKG